LGAWQVREKAVCCDAVGDDVTIIAHKDWSTNRVTVTETNWWPRTKLSLFSATN
jgi:hypothetical protein